MHSSLVTLPPLTPAAPLWAWAYEAISHRAEGMLEHIEGVREGTDIEAVHDMRVASRRLAAAMRVFRGCFPDRRYARLFREARQVTRALGAVRDLDVLIDYFVRLEEPTAEEQPGIRYFLAVQGRVRRKARRPMLKALAELEEGRFVGRLQRYLRRAVEEYSVGLGPCFTRRDGEADCGAAFREAAPGFLTERYQALYHWEPFVEQPERAFELHEMRIAAKWLRYTMEMFSPAYAGELKAQLDVIKKFQELLGDLHDSDVRLEILSGMLEAPLEPRGLEAAALPLPDGVVRGLRALRERETEVRGRCYRRFLKAWQREETRGFAAVCLRRIGEPDAPWEERG